MITSTQIIKNAGNNFGDQILGFRFCVLDKKYQEIAFVEEFHTFFEGEHVEAVAYMEKRYKSWKTKLQGEQ